MNRVVKTDVIVIRAGVIRCSILLQLRRSGVTGRECGQVGGATSSKGYGLIWIRTKSPYPYHLLPLPSARTYSEFPSADLSAFRAERGFGNAPTSFDLKQTAGSPVLAN